MKISENWKDYSIIATGDGYKLERWKDVYLLRPDPQVIWAAQTDLFAYPKLNAYYKRSEKGGGGWKMLKPFPDEWNISYDESELTGLAGVTTTFRVEPSRVILERTGNLRSRMVFEKDVPHDSLYQMAFGTMMITVCAKHLFFDIVPDGGVVDLLYTIEIENSAAGTVDYHLDIRAK